MEAAAVVEGFDVVEDGGSRLGMCGEAMVVNQFVLEAAPEGLDVRGGPTGSGLISHILTDGNLPATCGAADAFQRSCKALNAGLGSWEAEVARKLRLTFPGACYHVLNRGNYRQDVFASNGAAAAFETALSEVVARCGWVLHAFVVMRNHYHLAITTPEPNLVAGMQWLQATFATRFNRFRRVHGHLFQGRYKALLVEPGEALGRVVDYIHLNPVRAKVVTAEDVLRHRWSSLQYFTSGGPRLSGLDATEWLSTLRQSDEPETWVWYLKRLIRIGSNEDLQRRAGLVDLSSGWAIGTSGWRRAIAEEYAHRALDPGLDSNEVRDLREQRWSQLLAHALRKHGKRARDIKNDRKGAPWKVAIATELKQTALVPNTWIAGHLNMGHPRAVSSYISHHSNRGNMTYET